MLAALLGEAFDSDCSFVSPFATAVPNSTIEFIFAVEFAFM
jgi:hypothetical protein